MSSSASRTKSSRPLKRPICGVASPESLRRTSAPHSSVPRPPCIWTISRRPCVRIVDPGASLGGAVAASRGAAEVWLDVSKAAERKIVARAAAAGGARGRRRDTLRQVLENDLAVTGYFRLLPPTGPLLALGEKERGAAQPDLAAWAAFGAELLLRADVRAPGRPAGAARHAARRRRAGPAALPRGERRPGRGAAPGAPAGGRRGAGAHRRTGPRADADRRHLVERRRPQARRGDGLRRAQPAAALARGDARAVPRVVSRRLPRGLRHLPPGAAGDRRPERDDRAGAQPGVLPRPERLARDLPGRPADAARAQPRRQPRGLPDGRGRLGAQAPDLHARPSRPRRSGPRTAPRSRWSPTRAAARRSTCSARTAGACGGSPSSAITRPRRTGRRAATASSSRR